MYQHLHCIQVLLQLETQNKLKRKYKISMQSCVQCCAFFSINFLSCDFFGQVNFKILHTTFRTLNSTTCFVERIMGLELLTTGTTISSHVYVIFLINESGQILIILQYLKKYFPDFWKILLLLSHQRAKLYQHKLKFFSRKTTQFF